MALPPSRPRPPSNATRQTTRARTTPRPSLAALALSVAGALTLPGLVATSAAAAAPGTSRAPSGSVTPAAAAGGTVRTIGPQDAASLGSILASLRPGDTLRLRPGTYVSGRMRPDVNGTGRVTPGRPDARITVTGTDAARLPLIVGEVKLVGASYWTLQYLRVKAAVPREEALYMDGGVGWSVRKSEFFGAEQTGAYANVTIGGSISGAPRGFTFVENCVHHAGRTPGTAMKNTQHNVYVNFPGTSTSGGTIAGNVLFESRNGAGIKLGDGGQPRARGPWNVVVRSNTIADTGRAVLLHGDVRNNVITRNLMGRATAGFSTSPRTTTVYVNNVTNSSNSLVDNYIFRSSMSVFDPWAALQRRGPNHLRSDARLAGGRGCTGWQPTTAAATSYGR